MYSPLVYFISKNLVEMPGTFIGPLLTLLIIYWGIDYVSFFKVYLTMFLVAQIGFGLGLTISSLAQPGPNSGTLINLFATFNILFSGRFVNIATMPDWIGWI